MISTTNKLPGLRFLLFLILVTGFAGLAGRTQTVKTPWKAGVSRAVLTPDTDVWLAGYGSKRVATEKIHDLWMKALALEDAEGKRVVLITSDFQGVSKMMSDVVFAGLKEKYGLAREQVMLTFSHNHCGPRLGDDLIDYYPVEEAQEVLVAEYTRVPSPVFLILKFCRRPIPPALAI